MTTLTYDTVYALARTTGLNETQAITATAIAVAESGLNPNNLGDATLSKYGSRGLWQIFTGAHTASELGLGTGAWTPALVAKLEVPAANAHAMYLISAKGTNWHPWSTYQHDSHLPFMAKAKAAAARAKAGVHPVPTNVYPDAIAWAQAGHGDGQLGHCLKNVADAFKAAHGVNDATASWIKAGGAKGANTHTNKGPIPKNVPVYWTGGSHGYGHIAISLGADSKGQVWILTTDATPSTHGKFTKVKLEWVTKTWGLKLVGWSETLNGTRVHAHVKWTGKAWV